MHTALAVPCLEHRHQNKLPGRGPLWPLLPLSFIPMLGHRCSLPVPLQQAPNPPGTSHCKTTQTAFMLVLLLEKKVGALNLCDVLWCCYCCCISTCCCWCVRARTTPSLTWSLQTNALFNLKCCPMCNPFAFLSCPVLGLQTFKHHCARSMWDIWDIWGTKKQDPIPDPPPHR